MAARMVVQSRYCLFIVNHGNNWFDVGKDDKAKYPVSGLGRAGFNFFLGIRFPKYYRARAIFLRQSTDSRVLG